MKNKQGGFIGLIVVIISLSILGAVSYSAYSNNTFGIKTYFESDQYKETVNQNTDVNDNQLTFDTQSNIALNSNNTTVTTSANLKCDGSFDCLISAANQCQTATGIISTNNIENPFVKGLLHSGSAKLEINKNVSNCSLTTTTLTQSATLTNSSRIEMQAKGMTNAQIDELLKDMSESIKSTIGIATVCTGTNSAITSFLTDNKNGYTSGDYNVSANLESSKTEINTSSGQKLTCITQN